MSSPLVTKAISQPSSGHLYGIKTGVRMKVHGKMTLCQIWINTILTTIKPLTPVWVLIWFLNKVLVLKALGHKWHLYGRSSVWIFICLTKLLCRCVKKVHSLQENLVFPSSSVSPKHRRRYIIFHSHDFRSWYRFSQKNLVKMMK